MYSLGVPDTFLRFSFGISEIFHWYSLPGSANSPPLNALPVHLLRQVYLELLFCVFFPLCFLVGSWGSLGALFGPLGSILSSFWSLLGDSLVTFRGSGGFVKICTPLARKPTFWGPGGSQIHTFSDFFWLPILVAFFTVFFTFFIDFGVPQGAHMAPFGIPLGSILERISAPFPVWVPSPPQGGPKAHFWVLLGAILETFGIDFEHTWGYILWWIPRVFWRCPGEYLLESLDIPQICFRYSSGIP